MSEKKTKLIKALFISFIVVVLSIMMLEGVDSTFQNDSEKLVVGPIVADVHGMDTGNPFYGLGKLETSDNPEENIYLVLYKENLEDYEYSNYTSQVGLQGIIYRMIVSLKPDVNMYWRFRIVCCFLLVIVLMLIVWQLYKKYGLIFASIFAVVTMISSWVINFSSNLYWIEFTWYIPMLLGLLCLNYKEKRKYIYPLFFVAIFVKCLCGYEYVSTIMMSGIMFLLVEFICNKEERKSIIKSIFIIGVLSVAGFVLAYGIHAYIYGSGNILEGLKLMQVDLIERRTFGNAADFDAFYEDSLNASVFDVLVKYFWASGQASDGKLMLFIALVTGGVLAFEKFKMKKDIKFELSLFIIALCATLSWLILAKSHSYVHIHMNFVLFYFGWVQTSIYIVCNFFIEATGLKFNKLMKRCEV